MAERFLICSVPNCTELIVYNIFSKPIKINHMHKKTKENSTEL